MLSEQRTNKNWWCNYQLLCVCVCVPSPAVTQTRLSSVFISTPLTSLCSAQAQTEKESTSVIIIIASTLEKSSVSLFFLFDSLLLIMKHISGRFCQPLHLLRLCTGVTSPNCWPFFGWLLHIIIHHYFSHIKFFFCIWVFIVGLWVVDSEGGKYSVQLLMVAFRQLTLINHPQRLQECCVHRQTLARTGERRCERRGSRRSRRKEEETRREDVEWEEKRRRSRGKRRKRGEKTKKKQEKKTRREDIGREKGAKDEEAGKEDKRRRSTRSWRRTKREKKRRRRRNRNRRTVFWHASDAVQCFELSVINISKWDKINKHVALNATAHHSAQPRRGQGSRKLGTFPPSNGQNVQTSGEQSGRRLPSRGRSSTLTLHAESIGAVVGLEHWPIAVLTSILGRGVAALPLPPLGALGATGRPLGPVGPATVHWGRRRADEREEWTCKAIAAITPTGDGRY